MTYPLIIFALLCVSLALNPPSYNFNILVIVPSVDTTGSGTKMQSLPEQSWEKNEELLVGAELARHSVNQFRSPFNLSVTELRTDCASTDSQIDLVRELTAADGRITVAVIGYF